MSQNILITGANGNVARMMRPMLLARYGSLVVSDRAPVTQLAPGECDRTAALGDPAAVIAACKGIDAILHLGGQSVEATWDIVNEANIQGAVNLFEAARIQGVKRVIFASSNHAVGMYSRACKINAREKVRPDSRYGLSKAFGEALGALYADKYGLRVLSIRIGNVAEVPADERRLSIWLHPDDMFQLCVIGFEHPDLHNEIVFGASNNIRTFWDNETAFRLGYRPAHQAEDHAAHALAEQADIAADPTADALHGGGFGAEDFAGDLDRTLWN